MGPQIGDVIVKNDKLVFNGETIMSDEETEKEGERPKNLPEGETIRKEDFTKEEIQIPTTKAIL